MVGVGTKSLETGPVKQSLLDVTAVDGGGGGGNWVIPPWTPPQPYLA